jgi:GTPase SAR1 family protein
MTILDYTSLDKCIFLGETGAGKTSIINILTKNKFKPNNITDEITIYRTKWFYIYDTPGFKSTKNRKNNYIFIHDLKTIFLVIRYETRFESILNRYYELTSAIPEEYEDKIAVIISQFDLSANPLKDFKLICKTFDQTNVRIMTCSKYSYYKDLASYIHCCMSQMSKDEFRLDSSFFAKNI